MGERALQGVSAAPGITFGRAVVLDRANSRASGPVREADREVEAERARGALRLAATDLEGIAADLRRAGRGDEADIVETGVLMAMDPELAARVETLTLETGREAADALREAAEEMALELSLLPDPTLALRADDVRSVGRRAAAHLQGAARRISEGVLIAVSLGPADVAELAPTVRGIALSGGGVTAHAAIVARSLGLPMVVGAGAGLLEIEEGEEVVVDGDRGLVVRKPEPERAALARDDAHRRRTARETAIARRLEPAETQDGRRIRVLANASTVAELEEASRQGAEGIGLMRTELLFLEAPRWPSREEQVKVLRPVLARMFGQTATVRLFDFGGDKTPPFLRGISARGIEVLLNAPAEMRTHLAAVVEAGSGADLRLLVPMVTKPDDVRAVRAMLDTVLEGHGMPKVGAMIETPEAAEGAVDIAKLCDFLSIGTNDLTQLVLGLDRERSRKAPVMDPRVLSLIARTVRAGRRAQIPVDVCGEAASDASSLPVMVGLGVDELSVAAARVGQVRQWIRDLSFESSRRESERLLEQAGHASR
ncbi:MAG: phosphoenolpyruvate--protein phosphotransferase [Chloroflexi bacterium]|nr:MAG: phosphoenolpyruvate--protein phosphotransferase [Chloroflexota bacterium]TMG66095.1 MAG: phosphoenolpyruvate--protein phosphotransferase [Chloroflexota bacterium]